MPLPQQRTRWIQAGVTTLITGLVVGAVAWAGWVTQKAADLEARKVDRKEMNLRLDTKVDRSEFEAVMSILADIKGGVKRLEDMHMSNRVRP
jgi:hypothetical protein